MIHNTLMNRVRVLRTIRKHAQQLKGYRGTRKSFAGFRRIAAPGLLLRAVTPTRGVRRTVTKTSRVGFLGRRDLLRMSSAQLASFIQNRRLPLKKLAQVAPLGEIFSGFT